MVTLVCDKCDKPFAVDPAAIGPKATCPYCGDVKVVPGAPDGGLGSPPQKGLPHPAGGLGSPPHQRAEPGSAARAGLPPRDGPEVTVLVRRPALLRSSPFQVLALLAGGVGGLVVAGWLAVARTPPAGSSTAVVAWVLFAAGLVCWIVLAGWKVWTRTERLEITNKRIRLTKGLLARSSVEMLHRSVQDIEIDQSLWQRLLGTGTIRIDNASEENDEIELKDVPGPHQIRDVIDAYRI